MSYPQGYLYQPSASLALYSCPAYSTSVISGPRTDELGRSSSGSAFSPYAGSTAFTAPSPGTTRTSSTAPIPQLPPPRLSLRTWALPTITHPAWRDLWGTTRMQRPWAHTLTETPRTGRTPHGTPQPRSRPGSMSTART
uniref:Uncharacterized protein n=1 Tax=Castor canadensis TaxID=51338 RepID=A0A8C0ZWT9_CASCN